MKIDFNQSPSGIAPAVDSQKLAENMATTAENVTFQDGRIVPVRVNSSVQGVAAGTQEIYKNKWEIFYNTCGAAGSSTTGSGAFALDIDATEYQVTGINYTGANSATAANIQTRLRVATSKFETCVFDTDHFVITAYGYISELRAPSSGTNISGASFINTGVLTQGEDASEWLTFPDKKDIVPSPLVNDQFVRLYMTDSDGKINVSGLMGDRDLELPVPDGLTTITSAKLIDFSSTELKWYNGSIVDCGKTTGVELLNDGFAELIYSFPGTNIDFKYSATPTYCAGGPSLQVKIDATTSIPTTLTCSTNIIEAPPPDLTSSGVTFGGTGSVGDLPMRRRDQPVSSVPGTASFGVFDVVSATGEYANYTESIEAISGGSFLSAGISDTVISIAITVGSENPASGDIVRIGSEDILLSGGDGASPVRTFSSCTRGHNDTVAAAHLVSVPVTMLYVRRSYAPVDITVTINMHTGYARERNSYYLVTYLDDVGQESPPSDISNLTTLAPDEYNVITLPSASPPNIVSRRIYRIALLGDGGIWRKVVDLPISTNTYSDALPDSGLGISIGPYGIPPEGLDFLVMHPCGSLIGARGRSIFASFPMLPYAWPPIYEWVVGSDIMGLVIQSNDIIILTKDHPNILTGSGPDNFAREELSINQSCVSRHSVCKIGQSVFYASPDGLVEVSGASAQLVTKNIFDKASWNAMDPTSMIGEAYDKKLFFFTSTGGFEYDAGVVTTFDDVLVNLYRDTEDDTLYVLYGNEIHAWQATGARIATWASKDFLFQHPVTWSDAQVISESYANCTLNFYANDVLVCSYALLHDSAFKLPLMRPDRRWRFEIVTNSAIDELQIGTNGNELRN